jgi:hypothetical protein
MLPYIFPQANGSQDGALAFRPLCSELLQPVYCVTIYAPMISKAPLPLPQVMDLPASKNITHGAVEIIGA